MGYKKLERLVHRVSEAASGIGAIALAGMMFLTASDVVMRYVFNRPIRGAYEVSEILMLALLSFAFAYVQVKKGHIAIDVVVNRLGRRAQAVIDSIVWFMSLGLLSVITLRAIVQAGSQKASGSVLGTLGLPVYPFYYLLGFGCALLSLVLLLDLIDSIARVVKK